jgi:hypothetical protein
MDHRDWMQFSFQFLQKKIKARSIKNFGVFIIIM